MARYADWIGGFVTGDLGNSLANGSPVSTLLSERLANTLFLAALAAVISFPIAITLGLVSVLYRDSFIDRAINGVALASTSLPEFFAAYVLIMIFSVKLGFLPALSEIHTTTDIHERLYNTLLPALALSFAVIASVLRMTRATVLDIMSRAYIEMASLKGLSATRILIFHAMPNALAPILNILALNMAYLIVGVVPVEVVFTYPGLGQILVDSVSKRDFPIVQASSMIFAATYVLLNLLADVIAIVSNPRLMYPR